MVKFLQLYLGVAFIIFIVNLSRYIRCKHYYSMYNQNFKNKMPLKNYNIREAVFLLFEKSHLYLATIVDVGAITNDEYINEFTSGFEYAKGYFCHHMLHSLFWVFTAIEKLKLFTPVKFAKNKIIALMCALFEGFVVYLLGLYLDTTGTGSKILTYLLDFVTALFEHLAEFFQ